MAFLPKISNPKGFTGLLDSWRHSLTNQLPPTAEPIIVPRNTRARPTPGKPGYVRCEWDPGSPNLDGFDISWSEKPNFETSHSRRLEDPTALLLDIPVDSTTRFVYFRVRAFIRDQVSPWSPTTRGASALATATVPAPDTDRPGSLDFKVRLEDYAILGFYDITLGGADLDKVDEFHFRIAALDETDLDWYATTGALSGADPINIGVPAITGISRRGPAFQDGDLTKRRVFQDQDFVLMVDFDTASGIYKHEAFQIRIEKATGKWTLHRHGPTDLLGYARFGTKINSHVAGRRMYLLYVIPHEKKVGLKAAEGPGDIPQIDTMLLPSHCVLAVKAASHTKSGKYGPWKLINLVPVSTDARLLPPAPGLRTESGGQYDIGEPGNLVQGATSPLWIPVTRWETIRAVIARARAAPTGAAAIIYVFYIEPLSVLVPLEANRKVALAYTLTIADGKNSSFDAAAAAGPPDMGRNTPFLGTWPFEVLPTIGIVGGLFDATGAYTGPLPVVPDGGNIIFSQGGHLTWACKQIGSTNPGSGVDISIQT